MIRFVMIGLKQNSFNFTEYTNELMERVKSELKAIDYEFYSNKERIRKANINIKEKEFLVQFTYIVTHETMQLKIDISMVEKDVTDLDLHDLKIKLKDLVISDWEQCVWLEDRQSEAFAEELYKDIHSVENALRRLINTVLFYNLGGDWWEKYMPIDLINKYNQRNDKYKRRAPSFKNIHTNLMSIDTKDLVSILGFKTYKMKENNIFRGQFTGYVDPFISEIEVHPLSKEGNESLNQFQYIMNNLIYDGGSFNHFQSKLSELLTEQMEIDKDFWEDYFAKWFSCDFRQFQGQWVEFNLDRNHVAHNKLIDNKLFKKFKASMNQLLELILEAEEKFLKHLETEMTQYLDELEAESNQREFDYKDLIEEESGVNIRSDDSIIELFQEQIDNILDDLKQNLYYRSDMEITYTRPALTNYGEVFRVDYSPGNSSLKVEVEPHIDDSEGATSYVTFTIVRNNRDVLNKYRIYYTNGKAEYNEDQTNFMPLTYDELDVSGLENLREFLESFIEDNMPEVTDDEIAPYACAACHQFSIFLSEEDDDKYEQGKCLHCGHSNPVGTCIRCERILDQPEDGICDSCLEYIENQ